MKQLIGPNDTLLCLFQNGKYVIRESVGHLTSLQGRPCSRIGAAYDSFLHVLYETYGEVDRIVTGNDKLSRAPKTFAQMKLINAINGV